MNYWKLLSDWNTLDSVRAVHSFLEALALAFFALLVLFDVLAHVYDEHPKRAKGFERAGLWFFGVAVLAEILAYPYSRRNDELSEKVIVSLSGLAGTADQKARQALRDSSLAVTQSRAAVDDSGQAMTSASGALTIAQGARKEADTFEKDIVSAKTLATDAESHLAEALKQAAEATAELDRIKSPRSLANAGALVGVLKEFEGTQYVFTGVFSDSECIGLLREIDNALQLAGWKRIAIPSSSTLVINIGAGFQVTPVLRTGLFVETEYKNTPGALNAMPESLWPQYIRAAKRLKYRLALAVVPAQTDLMGPLGINQGNSTVVAILVGKKP